MKNYKFFQNKSCEFYPCHSNIDKDKFNCIFCYCPLYQYDKCGGNYEILENGIKDCSKCDLIHNKENYDYVIKKLIELSKD